jgi:hypothetical protein
MSEFYPWDCGYVPMVLSKSTISGNFIYQPFQVTDSNMVSDRNNVVTIDERSAN